MSIVDSILSQETIDDLASFLDSQSTDLARTELLAEFDALVDYEDADQWAAVVRICEALAIVGWGHREHVDAISRYNGDCWETYFITEEAEYRFRFGRWLKRKSGWVLRNPEFHASPDLPNRLAVDWKQNADKDFPVIDRDSLPTQRNYRRQMPIVMGIYGGTNATSHAVASLRTEFRKHLLATMTPSLYGDALEKFYFTLHCPALSDDYESQLKVGAFNTKHRAFYADLYFNRAFGDLPVGTQKAFVVEQILAAIDALAQKMKKRKIVYDVDSFRSHVEAAASHWSTEIS